MEHIKEQLRKELNKFLKENPAELEKLKKAAEKNNKTTEQIFTELVEWKLKKLINQYCEEELGVQK